MKLLSPMASLDLTVVSLREFILGTPTYSKKPKIPQHLNRRTKNPEILKYRVESKPCYTRPLVGLVDSVAHRVN